MTILISLNVNAFSEASTYILLKTFEAILASSLSKLVETLFKKDKTQDHTEVEGVIAFSTVMSLLFRELLKIPSSPRLIRKKISRFSIKYSQIVEAD